MADMKLILLILFCNGINYGRDVRIRDFRFPEQSFDYIFHAAEPAREMPRGVEREIIISGTSRIADDLVQWLFKGLFEGTPGRTYNIGSDQAVSIRELAETVRQVLHSNSRITVRRKSVPGKKAEHYVPEISRIQNELKASITTDLESAIRKSAQNNSLHLI
ncbi:MAG: hypothetical protein J5858_09170 [Lentisphaeria bacterium]|nr:hypothetical protein [Lentisphaeria bacterium]